MADGIHNRPSTIITGQIAEIISVLTTRDQPDQTDHHYQRIYSTAHPYQSRRSLCGGLKSTMRL